MNPTKPNSNKTKAQVEKVNRANQITTYKEPTTWVEISEDQLPENLRNHDKGSKFMEFCQIIRERGSDNLTIIKEQLIHKNGPPDSDIPLAHRCIFWKEVDLSPQISQTEVKNFTFKEKSEPDRMLSLQSCEELQKEYALSLDKNNANSEKTQQTKTQTSGEMFTCKENSNFSIKNLSLEPCEELQKPHSHNPGKNSSDIQMSSKSQDFSELLQNIVRREEEKLRPSASKPKNVPSSCHNKYKTDQDFGRVIEAYPMSCEWFSKKTDEEQADENDSSSSQSLPKFAIKNVGHRPNSGGSKKTCPGKNPEPTCDPENIKIQCTNGQVSFKLHCKKIEPDCNYPEVRYECEYYDDGSPCIDRSVLESRDLRCERIEAVHDEQPPVLEDDDEVDPNAPIKVHDVSDDSSPKKVSTMVCSKGGVEFTLKCEKITAVDPLHRADIRYLCEIGENIENRTVQPNEILGVALRCRSISNIIDKSTVNEEKIDDENFCIKNDHILLGFKISKTSLPKDDKPPPEDSDEPKEPTNKECPPKQVDSQAPIPPPPSNDSNLLKNDKLIYACRSKPKVDKVDFDPNCKPEDKELKVENSTKIVASTEKDTKKDKEVKVENSTKIVAPTEKDTNKDKEVKVENSTKIVGPTETETKKVDECKSPSTKIVEHFKSSFLENHNNTMNILKKATNDLMLTLTKSCNDDLNNESNNDNSLTKAKKTGGKILESFYQGTKDTIDGLAEHSRKYICTQKECQQLEEAEPPNCIKPCKPHETSGSPNYFLSESGNDTLTSIKRSCEDLCDTVRNTSQRLSDNTSKMFSGLTDNSKKWFDTSKNDTKEGKRNLSGRTLQKEWVGNSPIAWKQTTNSAQHLPSHETSYSSEPEDSNPITNLFASLKDKICSMFYDQDKSLSVSSSSNLSDYSDNNYKFQSVD